MSKLIILSGAGLSQESGIDTFRDQNGLWENYKIEEVCDFYTWEKNIGLVHDFYNTRRVQLGKVIPNEAHIKIAEWQSRYGKDRVINVTCNVDNLLERAGCQDVIHLHGELCKMWTNYNGIDNEVVDIGYTEYDYVAEISKGKSPKPFVVFFGECAPKYQEFWDLIAELTADDTVIIVGSSDQVVDFTSNTMWSGAKVVVVNPNPPSHVEGTTVKVVRKEASEGLRYIEDFIVERMQK